MNLTTGLRRTLCLWLHCRISMKWFSYFYCTFRNSWPLGLPPLCLQSCILTANWLKSTPKVRLYVEIYAIMWGVCITEYPVYSLLQPFLWALLCRKCPRSLSHFVMVSLRHTNYMWRRLQIFQKVENSLVLWPCLRAVEHKLLFILSNKATQKDDKIWIINECFMDISEVMAFSRAVIVSYFQMTYFQLCF